MGESSPVAKSVEEEELIAALEQIIETLESKKDLGGETKKIIAKFGARLLDISRSVESRTIEIAEKAEEDGQVQEIENHLILIQERIASFEEQPLIWDSDESYDYMSAIEKVQTLVKTLENRDSEDDSLLCLANDVLFRGMARLEEEFCSLLLQKQQKFEHEQTSFRSAEGERIDEGSVISSGDDTTLEDVGQSCSFSKASEDYALELVPVDVRPFLRAIVNLMFESNYGHECSRVYINARKDALDGCLSDLEMEKLSIEDVLKMEWEDLDSEIMKWIRAVKRFVHVHLVAEKALADQIFADIESMSNTCFLDSSKTSILVFLNFCEAICISPCRPEKLIHVLDMYEALEDLIPKIDSLFSFDAGLCVTEECRYILGRLGEYSKSIFLEFRRATASSSSENVKAGGGVHALTSYIMNYLKILTDSRRCFDEVMEDLDNESFSPDTRIRQKIEDFDDEASKISPTVKQFRSIIMILECNLEEISRLYRDESLRQFFLMNNIHYIAEKMKGPELMTILGELWIRKWIPKFQHHAMEYQKATWSPILTFLRDEGISNPSSNSGSRTILKERLRCFYLAFEEVYRNQTGWSIPDTHLRDDLTISISLRIIQAYRAFVGRYGQHISEKHIKYSADDLEGFLLDLFAGSNRSLHGSLKK